MCFHPAICIRVLIIFTTLSILNCYYDALENQINYMATKIYTKTGDQGETALFGGKRLMKDHQRIEAYGTVDELNSYIGLLRDCLESKRERSVLKQVQDLLFTIGSNLAMDPEKDFKLPGLLPADIELLETEIDLMNENLPELKHFILPGGHTTVSFCHIARCVCRRAERRVVTLEQIGSVTPTIIQFLNRLSDYLFILARKITQDKGGEEVRWQARDSD